VNGACETRAGEPRCQPAYPVPNCVAAGTGCDFMEQPNQGRGTGPGSEGNYAYTFVDVQGVQDRPVYFHARFNSLQADPYVPYVFSCEGEGTFYTLRSNAIPCSGGCAWDADGRITDPAALDAKLNQSLAGQCGPFEEGPVATFIQSNFAGNGYYVKFVPAGGWTGVARMAIAIQDTVLTPGQEDDPIPVVSYEIDVRPGSGVVERPGTGHFYEFVNQPRTFADALADASSRTHDGLQGHLVTIADAAENDFLRALGASYGSSFLIGFSDAFFEGTFQWISTGEPITYVNWKSGEPNDAGGEDAAVMTIDATADSGKWNDVGTTATHPYVVEYQ
jgi:hypothetical protein